MASLRCRTSDDIHVYLNHIGADVDRHSVSNRDVCKVSDARVRGLKDVTSVKDAIEQSTFHPILSEAFEC